MKMNKKKLLKLADWLDKNVLPDYPTEVNGTCRDFTAWIPTNWKQL